MKINVFGIKWNGHWANYRINQVRHQRNTMSNWNFHLGRKRTARLTCHNGNGNIKDKHMVNVPFFFSIKETVISDEDKAC